MRKLYGYIKEFWKNERNGAYFLVILLFLSTCIYFNYSYDFESSILKSFKKKPYYFLFAFLYYATPYYFASVAYAVCYRNYTWIKSLSFWLTSLFGLALLACSESFIGHRTYLESKYYGPILWFLKSCTNNLMSFLIVFSGLFLFWFFKHRSKIPFYGFSKRNFELKPYLIMVLIMFPLIGWASFQADFLASYPTYKSYGVHEDWGISEGWLVAMYESAYGIDFLTVEFFFRGFLILALAESMGTAAIVPMATLYCVYHFGKPMAEAMSSFIGGSILGIISYYSRSIYGGIIIHLAIAFLMELAAYLQHL